MCKMEVERVPISKAVLKIKCTNAAQWLCTVPVYSKCFIRATCLWSFAGIADFSYPCLQSFPFLHFWCICLGISTDNRFPNYHNLFLTMWQLKKGDIFIKLYSFFISLQRLSTSHGKIHSLCFTFQKSRGYGSDDCVGREGRLGKQRDGMHDLLETYMESWLVHLSLNLILFFSNDCIFFYLIMTSAERLRDLWSPTDKSSPDFVKLSSSSWLIVYSNSIWDKRKLYPCVDYRGCGVYACACMCDHVCVPGVHVQVWLLVTRVCIWLEIWPVEKTDPQWKMLHRRFLGSRNLSDLKLLIIFCVFQHTTRDTEDSSPMNAVMLSLILLCESRQGSQDLWE